MVDDPNRPDHPHYRLLNQLADEWDKETHHLEDELDDEAKNSVSVVQLEKWLAAEKIDYPSFRHYISERGMEVLYGTVRMAEQYGLNIDEQLLRLLLITFRSALADGFVEGQRFTVNRTDD